jgi:hypothetical protein
MLLRVGEGTGDIRGITGVVILNPWLEGAAAVRVRELRHVDHDAW